VFYEYLLKNLQCYRYVLFRVKTVRIWQFVVLKTRHLLESKRTKYLTIRVIEIENWGMGGTRRVSTTETEKRV